MEDLKLYRKRIIPEECVFLKDDTILYHDNEVIITKWNTLHPKKTLHHGYSCYFLERGFKVSKFYDHDNQLISWYCDIISHTFDPDTNTYVFTDLLADVILYPDGFVRVVDLDELADAQRDHLITPEEMEMALRRLDKLLSIIYKGAFGRIQIQKNDRRPCAVGGRLRPVAGVTGIRIRPGAASACCTQARRRRDGSAQSIPPGSDRCGADPQRRARPRSGRGSWRWKRCKSP